MTDASQPPVSAACHNRLQFWLLGVFPLLNTVALLLEGLNQSTHGTGNTGRALVVILVWGVVSVLTATVSAAKRGRDLGRDPAKTLLMLVGSIMLGPVFLLFWGYLAFAPAPKSDAHSDSRFSNVTTLGWLWVPIVLVGPWMSLMVVARLP